MKFLNSLLLLFLVLFAAACSRDVSQNLKNSYLFDEAKVFSAFTLQTNNGFFTQDNLKDKLTFIYFGYTSCPDVCPIEMSEIGAAYQKLTQAEKEKVQVLFVSVDPKRDTLQIVGDYARYFAKDFIGARIEHPAKLLSFTTQLGSYFEFVYRDDHLDQENQSYLVDHTSSFTIINPKGLYAGLSPTPHQSSDLLADLKTLIAYYF